MLRCLNFNLEVQTPAQFPCWLQRPGLKIGIAPVQGQGKGMKGLENPRALDALWTLSGRTEDGVQLRTPVAPRMYLPGLQQLHSLLCDCTI